MAITKTIEIKVKAKQAIKDFDKLDNSIIDTKNDIINLERQLIRLEKQLVKTNAKDSNSRLKLNKIIDKTKQSIKEEKNALKSLTLQKSVVNKETRKQIKVNKSLNKNVTKNRGAFNLLNRATGGLATRFKDGLNAVKSFNIGLKATRIAIIGTGIGALVILILALIQSFKKSEEGQNRFAKLMGVIGSVIRNITDLLSNLGTFIIDLFSGDGKAMTKLKSFGKAIFNVIGLPIKLIISEVETLGKVLGALFSGDVSGAFDALKQGAENIKDDFNEAKDSINGAKDALVDFAREVASDAVKAAIVADLRARADIIDRKLLVERALATQKISEIRLQAEDRENNSATERIRLLKEAATLEETITNKQIKAANLRVEAQRIENSLDLDNKDQKDALAKLTAKSINLDSQKLRLQRLLQTQITTARNDELAGIKAISDAKAKARKEEIKGFTKNLEKLKKIGEESDEAEAKRLDDIDKIREDFRLRNEELEEQTELEKIELEQERALAELERLEATEEQKFELLQFFKQKTIDAETVIREKKEVDDKKAEDEEVERKKEIQEAIVDLAFNSFALIGALSKKGSAIAKGVAVAQATIANIEGVINTFKSAAKNPITSVFPPFPFIQAGIAAAFGALQVKKILSTDPSGGGGLASANISGGAPAAPSFNLVAGSGTNQIAEGLANQPTPIRAFVVSSEVTNAQSLDRNIQDEGSI